MSEAGISCLDCHKKEKGIKKPSENFCSECHEKEYEKDFIEKREILKNLTQEIDSIISKKEKEIYRGFEKDKILSFLKILYEFNEFKKDKSLGAHNVVNYEDYIKKIKEEIEKF